MRPVVTFIVPTIGRDSLERALRSLQAQSLEHWNALVVFDGPRTVEFGNLMERCPDLAEGRIMWVMAPQSDSAGLTRNYGLDMMAQHDEDMRAQWVAFLDDDDTVGPEYVQELNDISAYAGEQIQAVVFRMQHPELGVLPDPVNPRIAWGQVGISYAVQWWLIEEHRHRFIREFDTHIGGPDRNEDINFLQRVIATIPRDPREDDVIPDEGYTHPPGAPWGLYVHPQIMYYVRPDAD